jgi:hypothetical protein
MIEQKLPISPGDRMKHLGYDLSHASAFSSHLSQKREHNMTSVQQPSLGLDHTHSFRPTFHVLPFTLLHPRRRQEDAEKCREKVTLCKCPKVRAE